MHETQLMMDMPPPMVLAEYGPPPSLFEQYAHTEVTVFGITGTLSQLVELCPVAHDPNKMSADAVDRFAAKVLQEAGVEIPEAYSHLFAEQPAQQSQEQAKSSLAPKKSVEQDAGSANAAAQTKEDATHEAGRQLEAERAVQLTIDSQPPATPPSKPVAHEIEHRAVLLQEAASAVAERPALALVEALSEASFATPEAVPLQQLTTDVIVHELQLQPAEAAQPVPHISPAAATRPSLNAPESPPLHEASDAPLLPVAPALYEFALADAAETSLDSATPELYAPLLGLESPDGFLPPAAEADEYDMPKPSYSQPTEAIVSESEAIILTAEEELVATYEDFQTALFEVAADFMLELPAPTADGTENLEPAVAAPPSPLLEVAEHLATLELGTVMPIISTLSEAIEEIQNLELLSAAREDIARAEEQLKELCIELFAAIGIPYDEEKIQQFVRYIARSEFANRLARRKRLGLEHSGTHEVKQRAPRFSLAFADVTPPSLIHSLLGGVMLKQAAAASS